MTSFVFISPKSREFDRNAKKHARPFELDEDNPNGASGALTDAPFANLNVLEAVPCGKSNLAVSKVALRIGTKIGEDFRYRQCKKNAIPAQ